MMDLFNLEGKLALVTGARRGIGYGTSGNDLTCAKLLCTGVSSQCVEKITERPNWSVQYIRAAAR